MTKIQRWFADDLSENYEVQEDGDWVKWEDVESLVKKNAALQAKIDALMFEYCPDEMAPEQIAEWERNQSPSYLSKGNE